MEGIQFDLVLIDLCDPCEESIADLRSLLEKLFYRRSWDGVLLMNVGPVGPQLVIDVKRKRYGPPGFYRQGEHICYTYSAELLEMFKFKAGRDVFSFKLDVPSFKAPWCLLGISKNHTIGEWSRGFISEEELRALMHYEPCYWSGYNIPNFIQQKRIDEAMVFPLYGC